MKSERSKEWWIKWIDTEPDCPIGAGVPDKEEDDAAPRNPAPARRR